MGDHEMYMGVHLLKDSLAVQNVYWRRRMAQEKTKESDEPEGIDAVE